MRTGTTDRWLKLEGSLAIHPATRDGDEARGRVRFIGYFPKNVWPAGQRGFITAMEGRREGECLLRVYPISRLEAWLTAVEGRSIDDVFQFKLEASRSFGRYKHHFHPVVWAVRQACGSKHINATPFEYRVLDHPDPAQRTLSIRVPRAESVVEYSPGRGGKEPIGQGELL